MNAVEEHGQSTTASTIQEARSLIQEIKLRGIESGVNSPAISAAFDVIDALMQRLDEINPADDELLTNKLAYAAFVVQMMDATDALRNATHAVTSSKNSRWLIDVVDSADAYMEREWAERQRQDDADVLSLLALRLCQVDAMGKPNWRLTISPGYFGHQLPPVDGYPSRALLEIICRELPAAIEIAFE